MIENYYYFHTLDLRRKKLFKKFKVIIEQYNLVVSELNKYKVNKNYKPIVIKERLEDYIINKP